MIKLVDSTLIENRRGEAGVLDRSISSPDLWTIVAVSPCDNGAPPFLRETYLFVTTCTTEPCVSFLFL